MRIGLYHGSLPQPDRKPGGVDIVVHNLANALANDGRDHVTVLSLVPRPAGAAYDHRLLLPTAHWTSRKLLRLYGFPAVMNQLGLGGNLDVLHLHGDDWFYVHRTCPTVRTLHGSALHESRTATSVKRRLSQRAIYYLERVSTSLATLSLGVGPDTVALYGTDQLIDNGVDLTRFFPGPKAAVPVVLFVGTWAGRKRGKFLHDQFINVIRPAVPTAELYMVADHCPAAAGVYHVTRPDDDRLAALYRSAWVFAYPSRYEGFGLPYVEAMASGTAVVTSPNQGAAHVLDAGRLGCIVEDADFATTVIRLLKDTSERGRFESSGRIAAESFAWERVAQTHRAVYQSAIDRWTRP